MLPNVSIKALPSEDTLYSLLSYFQGLHGKYQKDLSIPSLDRMRKLMEALGNPETQLPQIIHVAGTNGKGSTIAFLGSILHSIGMTVHTYTSPHLISVCERISLGGSSISPSYFSSCLMRVQQASQDDPITYFEALTAAAFLAFSENQADVLLLEVGIGGRFDATNVIPAPQLALMTSLSLDHQDFLGNTIEDIAKEKAEIIKKGTNVIVAPQLYQASVRAVLEEKVKSVEASLSYVTDLSKIPLGLIGKHQQENAQAAITAAQSFLGYEIPLDLLIKALIQTKWQGRMEKILDYPEIWIDGAHNQGGFDAIAQHIDLWPQDNQQNTLYFNILETRDPQLLVNSFKNRFHRYIVIDMEENPEEGQKERFHSPDKFVKLFSREGICCEVIQISQILNKISKNTRNLILGSLYIVGRIKQMHEVFNVTKQ